MLNFFKTSKESKSTEPIQNESISIVDEITERLANLSDTTVKDIMVPRIDVITLPVTASIKEITNLIRKEGHSRIPVWDKTVDDIVGVLYIKDLFPFFFQSKPKIELKKLLLPPYFVPESKKILDILKEFQQKKNHLAIVVDEYGGVSGIVALEDVLEEIVGEIQDEHDNEEEDIIKITNNEYMLDARTYLEDINEEFNINLPTDKSDTIGGLVFDLFGRIPKKGDKIQFENITFQVTNIDINKINKIKMTINLSKLFS